MGKTGATRARRFKRLGRNVLELAGDDIDGVGEARDRVGIGVGADRLGGGDVEGRCAGLIGIDVGLEAEPARGHGQHAAELAAAEDADGAAGRQRSVRHYPRPPRGWPSVWAAR